MAATLQRRCSGGITFVIIAKIITKHIVPRIFFCNNFGQAGIAENVLRGMGNDNTICMVILGRRHGCLVAPRRAMLRYYRCDTPYRAILIQGG